MEHVCLPGQNKLFLNKNLLAYYKMLQFKNKNLHSLGKINSFFTSGDTITITVSEKQPAVVHNSADDFGKYFSDIDFLLPERSISIKNSVCWVNGVAFYRI